MKRTEWRKFIDYFGQSIEADPYRVGKDKIYLVHIRYIPIPSSVKLHISRHHLDKHFNLELPKLRLYQLTKNLSAKIAPHISSSQRDLGMIFDKKYFI